MAAECTCRAEKVSRLIDVPVIVKCNYCKGLKASNEALRAACRRANEFLELIVAPRLGKPEQLCEQLRAALEKP